MIFEFSASFEEDSGSLAVLRPKKLPLRIVLVRSLPAALRSAEKENSRTKISIASVIREATSASAQHINWSPLKEIRGLHSTAVRPKAK